MIKTKTLLADQPAFNSYLTIIRTKLNGDVTFDEESKPTSYPCVAVHYLSIWGNVKPLDEIKPGELAPPKDNYHVVFVYANDLNLPDTPEETTTPKPKATLPPRQAMYEPPTKARPRSNSRRS